MILLIKILFILIFKEVMITINLDSVQLNSIFSYKFVNFNFINSNYEDLIEDD